MQAHQDEPSDNRLHRVLRWTERLLVIAGVVMLAAWVLLVVDARMSQRVARQSLEAAILRETSASLAESEAAMTATLEAPAVLRGSAIAALSIPRIHLSAVVLQGSDSRTLRHGPGHLENTALPGEAGNAVIAGHRDSFFRPLRKVQLGDDIFVDTLGGRFQYRVTSLRVVKPSDLSVLEGTDEAMLTLITCYPFWVLGNAPDRFVVRATRVASATAPVAAVPTSPGESIRASRSGAPEVKESSVPAPITIPDDDTLVRQTIESYRLTYNGRLISRNEVGETPLIFDGCDITVVDDHAEATCEPSSRTFALERAQGTWMIKSILVK